MTRKPTVFAIDDEHEILELYESALSSSFEVRLFSSGKAAMSAATATGTRAASAWPDAMLVDLVMPELDGIETIAKSRDQGYQGPFVICSGMADKNYAIQALAMKAFALFEKPFAGQELRNIMKHAVTESKLIDINNRMMSLNVELAKNAAEMTSLYEQRLAEAESLMFGAKKDQHDKDNFLDHQKYYEIFSRVSKRIDALRFDIQNLQKEQEDLLAWRNLN